MHTMALHVSKLDLQVLPVTLNGLFVTYAVLGCTYEYLPATNANFIRYLYTGENDSRFLIRAKIERFVTILRSLLANYYLWLSM